MPAFEKNRRPLRILFVGLLFAGIFPTHIVADNKEKNHSPAKSAAAESDSSAFELIGSGRLIVAHDEQSGDSPQEPQSQAVTPQPKSEWHYGGFFDLGCLLDFNHPSNHLFRNRGTTPRVNESDLNMAAAYLTKDATANSRWGMELEAQAGEDSKIFGFSATAPNLGGANWLRQIGKANVSCLAPVGKGLTVQGGIFSSLIGYDSLYAKDNFTYTRPWGADYTPYLMFGVNASYAFSKKVTATVFVINDYFHLAHPNNVPSWGGQIAYTVTEHLTFKEIFLYGPHQSDTALEFWRFFSDSIAEWKRNPVTVAFEYQAGTEKLATVGNLRALWSLRRCLFT
ncbi:MAG: hypothetical protein AUH11_04225 [Acidobacteria bacterium 13_2_20CM_57_17]|nr:MAG: hypothetical protein AUH11_04225 [Acidobacteria bacterium 13_2_20CM_57_17]